MKRTSSAVSFFVPTRGLLALAAAGCLVGALDARAAATLQFSAAEFRVSEASSVARITLTRSGPLNEAVTVECSMSGGTATEGGDYTAVVTNVTVAAGKTSGTVIVPILSDTLHEPAETVGLTLSGPGAGTRASAVLTIVDNDPAGVISLARAAFSTIENRGTGVVQVVRTGGTASEVSVLLTTSDGTATENADYTPVSTRVVFGANEKSKTVPVLIADDDLPEGNETVNLQLSAPDGGATLGKQTNATFTIVDDEIAISFSRAAYSAPERGGTAMITVLRSGPRQQAVTVNLSTTDGGTAIPGVEYTPLTNKVVRFGAGVAAQTVALKVKDDTLDDGDKTVELELTDPSSPAQLGTIQRTVVTLVDNDAGGTLNFSAPAYNIPETAAKAPILIRRTGGAASGVTVQLRTADDTATAGEDYREVVTNLTFKAGELVKTVFIPILNDAQVEATETVLLSLSDATGGAVLGTNAQAVLRIANDDRGGAIQFAGTGFTGREGGTNAVLTLTRTGGLAAGIEVEVTVTGGTATPGEDYQGLPVLAQFAPGATTAKVLVPLPNDAAIEGDETVTLQLANPTGGATLGARTNATLTIKDDEQNILGIYRGTLNFTVSGCNDRSDNESGTMPFDLTVTEQTPDTFSALCTMVGAKCGYRKMLALIGQVGPNGEILGAFLDDDDGTQGTITGKIVNGSLQLALTDQPDSGGCRVQATLPGKLYAPSSTGFAPGLLTGIQMETTQAGRKGQMEFKTNNRFNRRESSGDISTSLYIYTKTGPNTGVMRISSSESDDNAVVSITYTSPTQGRFVYSGCDGGVGTGTFVIGDFPVPDPTPIYQVWGGNFFSTTEPNWWEKGYNPDEHGYVLLGAADTTTTFNGSYPFYIIRTPPRYSFTVDAVQGSDGTYFGANITGNADGWWNIGGPPDGAGAVLGQAGSDPGGFVVIDATGYGLSSLTVYLVP